MNVQDKIPCSVEILTRNSERTLERCLESVRDFAEIIILDGNSTDRTREIALRYGARIEKQYETSEPLQRIDDFSRVRNKGLGLATHDWFMYIDSDEYLSLEAADEIRAIAASSRPAAHAWWQPRKYVSNGKIIDCASTYPNRQIRFFNRGWVLGFIKPIHERIELKPDAKVGVLKGVEYVPWGTLEELRSRWSRYTLREVAWVNGAPKTKIFRLIIRQFALLGFYVVRYMRNRLFCRGTHLSLRYEILQHAFRIVLAYKLIKLFFRHRTRPA